MTVPTKTDESAEDDGQQGADAPKTSWADVIAVSADEAAPAKPVATVATVNLESPVAELPDNELPRDELPRDELPRDELPSDDAAQHVAEIAAAIESEPLRAGDIVRHPKFGDCNVHRITDKPAYVHMAKPNEKVRRLSLDIVEFTFLAVEGRYRIFTMRVKR
tara:strand:- start:29225 stop:29713 length:489 start_codon:yes stop_codon:yes gene_type:complete